MQLGFTTTSSAGFQDQVQVGVWTSSGATVQSPSNATAASAFVLNAAVNTSFLSSSTLLLTDQSVANQGTILGGFQF